MKKKPLGQKLFAWFALLLLLSSSISPTAIGQVFAEDTVATTEAPENSSAAGDTTDGESVASETPAETTEPATASRAADAGADVSEQDSTFDADLSVFTETTDEDGNQKLSYYTGESILPYAHFQISGTGVVIPNAKSILKFPKENVDGKPSFTRSATATSWEVTEDDDYWYVTYNFDQLAGGQIISIPFPFKMKQGTTPDGFETPVTYTLYDGDGHTIRTATTTFIAKTNPVSPIKEVAGGYWGKAMSRTGSSHQETIDGRQVWVADFSIEKGATTTTPSEKDKAPYAQYFIGVTSPNSNYGKYTPDNVKIVDYLPAGAVMSGTADSEGYYRYNGYKWTYDAATHTATYTGRVDGNSRGVYIQLSYPNQSYDTVHVNKAIITLEPGTENEKVLDQVEDSVKWNPKYIEPSGDSRFVKNADNKHPDQGYIYQSTASARDTFVSFHIYADAWNNSVDDGDGKLTTEVSQMEDFGLDDRLYYRRIKLSSEGAGGRPSAASEVVETGYKVYGVTADGTEKLLGEDIAVGEWLDIDDQVDQYDRIKIVFDSPIDLDNQAIKFDIDTHVKEDTWKSWATDGVLGTDNVEWGRDKPQRLYNSATVTYSKIPSGGTGTATGEDSTFFRKEKMFVKSGNNSDYVVTYGDNNHRKLSGIVDLQGNLLPLSEDNPASNYSIDNVSHISLLPVGVEYVEGTGKVYNGETNAWANTEPTVVQNYKNTGRTAVIFNLGTVTRSNHTDAEVSFDVDVTIYTQTGENVVDHYLTWDDNDTKLGARGAFSWWSQKDVYADEMDLDSDSDTSENFLKGKNTITFIPPREVLIRKYVSLDKTGWFLNSPYSDVGTDVYYKVQIFNNSLMDLKNVSVLDVLPASGDHKIVANESGEYLPRESVFAVSLVESLESVPENEEVLQKYDVTYSTSEQGANLSSARDASFVPADQISDFSQVKMVKIRLKEGEVLKVKETSDIIIHGSIPYDEGISRFSVVNNSAAVSLNDVDYVEGNQVSSKTINYEVDGTIFFDLNEDGKQDDGEKVLSGYTVQLMNADGTEYLDESGKTVTAVSDDEGYYHMNVYKRGSYYVKVSKRSEKELFTTTYATEGTRMEKDKVIGNDTTQDASDILSGTTNSFTLDPSNIPIQPKATSTSTTSGARARTREREATEDESSSEEASNLSYDDYLRTTNSSLLVTRNVGIVIRGELFIEKVDEEGNPLAGVEFTVTKDGETLATLTTDADGKAELRGQGYGTYTVTETKTAGDQYALDSTVHTYELTQDSPSATLKAVNKIKRSTIVINKVDADTQAVLSGVTFELRDSDGKVLATQTTDSSGQAIFTDVLYGDYTVVETATLENYILDSTPITISVTEDGATITKTVTNKKTPTPSQPETPKSQTVLPLTGSVTSAIFGLLGLALLGLVIRRYRTKKHF